MKRITIFVIVTALYLVSFSQNKEIETSRQEVHEYFKNTIFPELSKERESYMESLSDQEKEILKNCQKAKNNYGDYCRGKGRSGKGMNKQKPRNRRPVGRFNPKVDEIIANHPEENSTYEKFLKKNSKKWIADIEKIHKENGIEPRVNKEGKTGYEMFMKKISYPAWLLIWDGESLPFDRKQWTRKGDKRRSYNPELRKDLREYTINEILPVVARERKAFDKYLSEEDKQVIDEARQKIIVRKEMFRSWHNSEDFEPGKRAKDSNFDGMREDMRVSMQKVRDIAKKHSIKIRESMAIIRLDINTWKEGVRIIAEKHDVDEGMVFRKSHDRIKESMKPVKFLLFDPEKDRDGSFMGYNESIKVLVYPNPVTNNGTIAILNGLDKEINVILYTKSGEKVKELYSGIINNDREEIPFSAEELDSDIYIAKIKGKETDISRKIVIKSD
jgi:hypothetical protein